MNKDFESIRGILEELRVEYAKQCPFDMDDPSAPITERDIVAEIRQRLKPFCFSKGYHVHCEIKPATDENISTKEMKTLPRIDVVILSNKKHATWISAAKTLQDKYHRGSIEARFSSIPVNFFHSAIEVKIQSKVKNAKDDIDTLRWIYDSNEFCNCFFVLLNARGRYQDHEKIKKYAEMKEIAILEYSSGIN